MKLEWQPGSMIEAGSKDGEARKLKCARVVGDLHVYVAESGTPSYGFGIFDDGVCSMVVICDQYFGTPEQQMALMSAAFEHVYGASDLFSSHQSMIEASPLRPGQQDQRIDQEAMMIALLGSGKHDVAELRRRGHAAYALRGLVGEVGEVADSIKVWIDYGRPLGNLLEELSDVLFFVAYLAEIQGWTLRDVALAQISKLRDKFGGIWTREKAAASKPIEDPALRSTLEWIASGGRKQIP